MKKKLIVFFMAIAFTVGMASTAKASLILFDWDFYADGSVDVTYDDTSFNWGPDTGVFTQTITGAGLHDAAAVFDYDDAVGVWTTDTASTGGSLAAGQSWEVDNPDLGFIWGDAQFGSLTDSDWTGGFPDDVAMAMGWNFNLLAGQTATINYFLSSTAPVVGFNMGHLNNWAGDTIYLSSTLDITGGGVGRRRSYPGAFYIHLVRNWHGRFGRV